MEAEANMVQTFQKTPRAFPRRAPYSDGNETTLFGRHGATRKDSEIIGSNEKWCQLWGSERPCKQGNMH